MSEFKVAVLLAAYNAKKWLAPQIETLLAQEGCDITIYISLDASMDGSEAWLPSLAAQYHNIILLPMGQHFGSAAKNFYRLIREVNVDAYDYVAFSDQDDLWKSNKVISAIHALNSHNAVGYSSNVTAYWSDEERVTIKKDYPQTEIDYFFESAGPGCTYLFPVNFFRTFQFFVRKLGDRAEAIDFHDWLVYAFVRSQEAIWVIDAYEGMLYRQHDHNVIGARRGIAAFKSRLIQVKNGWYRRQILLIFEVLEMHKHPLYKLILSNRWYDRCRLLRYTFKIRRKRTDALVLCMLIILNQW